MAEGPGVDELQHEPALIGNGGIHGLKPVVFEASTIDKASLFPIARPDETVGHASS